MNGHSRVDYTLDARSWCIYVGNIPKVGKSLLEVDQLDPGVFFATTKVERLQDDILVHRHYYGDWKMATLSTYRAKISQSERSTNLLWMRENGP